MFVAIFIIAKALLRGYVSVIQVLLHIVRTRFTYINSLWNKFQFYYHFFLKHFSSFCYNSVRCGVTDFACTVSVVCALVSSIRPPLQLDNFECPLEKISTRSRDIVCRFSKCEHFSQRFWVIRPNFCQSRR